MISSIAALVPSSGAENDVTLSAMPSPSVKLSCSRDDEAAAPPTLPPPSISTAPTVSVAFCTLSETWSTPFPAPAVRDVALASASAAPSSVSSHESTSSTR